MSVRNPPSDKHPDPSPTAAAPQGPTRRADRTPPVGRSVRLTRTGAAWVAIAVAMMVLILLIVFLMQNTVPVEVAFFGLRGTAPLAVTLLIAGAGFAIVTLIVGSLRIGQLRRRITRTAADAGSESP